MTLPAQVSVLIAPIVQLDWWISVHVRSGDLNVKIHSTTVRGLGNRYLGRLLCRWDEDEDGN